MDKADVIEIIAEIKDNYPFFDESDENIERHVKFLHDFPFETAMKNIEQHIRTGKYPPNIAEIRGSLGEQLERERMRTVTEEYFLEREEAAKNACPPPPGWKEAIYAKLGRHSTESTE